MERTISVIKGDGIGPEVMAQVRRIIDWYADKRGLTFDVSEDLVGGAAYDVHGVPLADATMEKAQEVDAVLLGAVVGSVLFTGCEEGGSQVYSLRVTPSIVTLTISTVPTNT